MSDMLHRVNAFHGHRGPVYALLPQAPEDTFLSASGDGSIVQWHVDQPEQGRVLARVNEAVFALHAWGGGSWLLAGTESGSLRVIDLKAGAEVRHFTAQRKGVFGMVTLPDGRVATSAGDGTVALWVVQDEAVQIALERQIPLCEEKVRSMAVSHDGHWLAVACGDGMVRVLDLPGLNELHTLSAHEEGAQSVAWHPHKPVLLSGGKDGQLRVWRTDDAFSPLHAWPAHKAGIYAIAFSASGDRFATASRDKTAKLWNAHDLRPLARVERANDGHTHSVNTLCWIGSDLFTAGDDRRILAWRQAGA
ncbi:MAG: WD40 repeat domain-containing protein [Flavobacteriales bacterium]|nr:WD40 repeat domain-containing protein [Flavobacteriales bacterium]